MHILDIILIALGLSMDSLAVSIANGILIKRNRLAHALRCGLCFGLMQMAMPLVGWLAGMQLRTVIEGIDHWIAFIILSVIGIKMIYQTSDANTPEKNISTITTTTLLCLGMATSIDALAVGIGFAFLKSNVLIAAGIIGLITFVSAFLGFLIGGNSERFLGKHIEKFGGIILIGIGTKILIAHLLA